MQCTALHSNCDSLEKSSSDERRQGISDLAEQILRVAEARLLRLDFCAGISHATRRFFQTVVEPMIEIYRTSCRV